MEKNKEKKEEIFVIKGQEFRYNEESGKWHWEGYKEYVGYDWEEMEKKYLGEVMYETEMRIKNLEDYCENQRAKMRDICLKCKELGKCNVLALKQKELDEKEKEIIQWNNLKKRLKL